MKRYDWHTANNAERPQIKMFTIDEDCNPDETIMVIYPDHFPEAVQEVMEAGVEKLCNTLNTIADEVDPVNWGEIWP